MSEQAAEVSERHSTASLLQANYGFKSYLVLNFIGSGTVSAFAIVAWSSSMGFGTSTFQALEDYSWLMMVCGGLCVATLVILYLLDFFHPPHLPGQWLRLWDGDRWVGRGLLGLAGVFAIFAVLFLTPTYPGIPVVVSTFFVPLTVGAVHFFMRPTLTLPGNQEMREIVEHGGMQTKVQLLKEIIAVERELLGFYKAATVAFFLNFLIILPLWIVFGLVLDKGRDNVEEATDSVREKIYIQWATPVLVAISNLVFTLFCLLRVLMQRSYRATDYYRNQLMKEAMESPMKQEMAHYASQASKEHLGSTDYANRHVVYIKMLSTLVKVVGTMFVLAIGAFYVVGQLLYANSDIAQMVLALLAAFFVCFVLFVAVAFNRVLQALGQWFKELPAWKVMHSVATWPATRAFFVCIFLPAIPVVLLLSFLTQLVRRCRGLDKVRQGSIIDESFTMSTHDQPQPEPPPAPSSRFFTNQIAELLQMVEQWDFIMVTWWCYLFCGLFVLYNIFPLMLNVGLSWFRSATADWPFGVIVGSTFMLGVVAFLLPPVPGLTVYIFGGLVISGTCPWGFWPGTVINVGMCWALKLFACAIQQVCIGGLLGRSLWVRRNARVHQVAIRCVEAELRQKGMRLGKVAILCGGPDWPTSVLAGVLGLSLWECELGTVPIIGFVLPCSLTGSLYIRKSEGQIWSSSADLMIVASVVVNMLLWAVAFWAIQNRLEMDYEKLNRQLPENVDLHWLDYREEELSKRVTVKWKHTPVCVRGAFVLGAIIHILVCDGLFMGYSYLFGSFAVQDDINTLVFLPTEGKTNELFTWNGLGVLGLYVVSYIFVLQYALWLNCKTAAPRRAAKLELAASEAQWKEDFLNRLATEEAERIRKKEQKLKGEEDALPVNSEDEAKVETTTYEVPQEFGPSETPNDEKVIGGRCSLRKPALSQRIRASGGGVTGLFGKEEVTRLEAPPRQDGLCTTCCRVE